MDIPSAASASANFGSPRSGLKLSARAVNFTSSPGLIVLSETPAKRGFHDFGGEGITNGDDFTKSAYCSTVLSLRSHATGSSSTMAATSCVAAFVPFISRWTFHSFPSMPSTLSNSRSIRIRNGSNGSQVGKASLGATVNCVAESVACIDSVERGSNSFLSSPPTTLIPSAVNETTSLGFPCAPGLSIFIPEIRCNMFA